MQSVMETVSFQLKPASTRDAFVQSSAQVNTWARAQPGFQSRALSSGDDGTWVDTVFWDSAQAAQQASALFMQDLAQSAFMAMIDPTTVQMAHRTVHSRA